jgi:uncharacterized protein DUF559
MLKKFSEVKYIIPKQSMLARQRAQDPEWRIKVSLATKRAMQRPEVRRTHLAAIRRYVKLNGTSFKGGNGQRPTKFVRDLERILKPLGYIREYAIGIPNSLGRKHGGNYKVDFALPSKKIAIECDGPCHRNRKHLDEKKDTILKKLGWRIIRVPHD